MTAKERRGFRRMDDYLSFTYRRISRQEFDMMKEKYLAGTVDDQGLPSLPELDFNAEEQAVWRVLSPVLEVFHERISFLNHKLDMIISLLRGEKAGSVLPEKPRHINISGSGCKFIASELLEEETLLEMKIYLSGSSQRIIPALARVMHVTPVGGKSYALAVRFEAISYNSRETLVQYIFRAERSILRAERERKAQDELKGISTCEDGNDQGKVS